jgi:hypothetical protein
VVGTGAPGLSGRAAFAAPTRHTAAMIRPRLAAVALVALAGVCAPAAVASAQDAVFNVEIKDRRSDTDGRLDLVRVSLGPSHEEQMVGQVTMARRWGAGDLRVEGRPPGTLCYKLYIRRRAGDEPPDYLVCATAPAAGEELAGSVLRNRSNGLPRALGAAVVRRLSNRTIELRFARSLIGAPARLSFVVEGVTFAKGCPMPQGCMDLSPEARPARLRLG